MSILNNVTHLLTYPQFSDVHFQSVSSPGDGGDEEVLVLVVNVLELTL